MFVLMMFICGHANAHQWTPTYPVLKQSFVPNIFVTTMELFNSRNDVEFYEISVLDKDMDPVPFATPERIIKVKYTNKKRVEVYIREKDLGTAVYVCTTSKLLTQETTATSVSSRICSKFKMM